MPKKKTPAGLKGGPKNSPRPQNFRRRGPGGNPLAQFSGNNSHFAQPHGYTLAEEARNTAHNRRGLQGRDARLRYKPMTFISAGLIDPLKDLEPDQKSPARDQHVQQDGPESSIANAPVLTPTAHPTTEQPLHSTPDDSHPQLFTIDTDGDKALRLEEDIPGPEVDPGSDSSEEVILFKGRDASRHTPNVAKPDQDDVNANADSNSMKLHDLDHELQVVEQEIQNEVPPPEIATKTEDYISVKPTSKPRQASRQPHCGTTSDEEAAIVADYMANMQNDDSDEDEDEGDHPEIGSHAFHMLRDLGGTDSDAIPDQVSSEDDKGDGSDDEVDEETQRRRAGLDDERMAQRLAKQEELGLGSDDVLLFDGADSDNDWNMAPRSTPRRKKKGSSRKDKMFQSKGQYPSATQMADAFDEMDLMDWHRPSLNNFNKGPKAFDLSDSELEEAMSMAWKKDRLKKAEKKRAREELRSQGLLGKNVNPDDLRVKYRGGMSLDDLANELETFMQGSQEQLILPPFDKSARKTVHAVANKFKVKSQSAGKGKDRYPVLYRSKATLPFDQVVFDRTFGRIKQTWFPRVDVDDKVVNESRLLKRAEIRDGKSRFGKKNQLTLREGDVVGQHAAELGAENKGRAMLEKMGWSKGMSLGTGENKGITVPIMHVVKKTKAGLGDA